MDFCENASGLNVCLKAKGAMKRGLRPQTTKHAKCNHIHIVNHTVKYGDSQMDQCITLIVVNTVIGHTQYMNIGILYSMHTT